MPRLHLEVHAEALIVVAPVRSLLRPAVLVDAPRVVVIVPWVPSVAFWAIVRCRYAPPGPEFEVLTHFFLLVSLAVHHGPAELIVPVEVHRVRIIAVSLVSPAIGLLVRVPARALHWEIVLVVVIVGVLMMGAVIVGRVSVVVSVVGDASSSWVDIPLVLMCVIILPLAIVMIIIMAIEVNTIFLMLRRRRDMMLLVVLLRLESKLRSLARVLSEE